jgi:hypothetical protein
MHRVLVKLSPATNGRICTCWGLLSPISRNLSTEFLISAMSSGEGSCLPPKSNVGFNEWCAVHSCNFVTYSARCSSLRGNMNLFDRNPLERHTDYRIPAD